MYDVRRNVYFCDNVLVAEEAHKYFIITLDFLKCNLS